MDLHFYYNQFINHMYFYGMDSVSFKWTFKTQPLPVYVHALFIVILHVLINAKESSRL